MYFGFRPWNPYEMTKNEMKVLCNLLNICLFYYNLIVLTCLGTCGSVPTSHFAILTSFSINLVCGFTSKSCILDTFFFVVGIVSTCFCSWIIYGFFSSWPPLLKFCGFFVYTSPSWVVLLLKSYGSLVCISSSWVISLGLPLVSSF
jgi:hypothetical protein